MGLIPLILGFIPYLILRDRVAGFDSASGPIPVNRKHWPRRRRCLVLYKLYISHPIFLLCRSFDLPRPLAGRTTAHLRRRMQLLYEYKKRARRTRTRTRTAHSHTQPHTHARARAHGTLTLTHTHKHTQTHTRDTSGIAQTKLRCRGRLRDALSFQSFMRAAWSVRGATEHCTVVLNSIYRQIVRRSRPIEVSTVAALAPLAGSRALNGRRRPIRQ